MGGISSLRAWSDDEVADYEVRLAAFEGAHVFVEGEGVKEDEEEEGEEAEEEEAEDLPLTRQHDALNQVK